MGKGGTSAVYLGAEKKSGKRYAIKSYADNNGCCETERELELLGQLNHPAIPKVHDLVCEGKNRYAVMEYVAGNTLKEVILREGRISEQWTVKWGMELCDVLSYLHRRIPSVVYRDVKPANIIISPVFHVRLIDFGAAVNPCIVKATEIKPVGTPGYAPPEQFEPGGKLDGRADIYALGATLYYMLTGIPPCESSCLFDSVQRHDRKVSAGMAKILVKCLEPDREKRYHYCEEVKEDLEHIGFPREERKRLYITRSEILC